MECESWPFWPSLFLMPKKDSGTVKRDNFGKGVRMQLSARNQFQGKVVDVKTGAIMGEVTIEVNGPITVVAEITKASTERLGLAAGDDVTAIIKATEILVGK